MSLMKIAAILFIIILLILTGLYVWRLSDHRADRAEAERLLNMRRANPPVFVGGMVDGLPEPARRYFLFTIKEGTPLHTVAEISMAGRFGMGDKDAPNYLPMEAEEVLAAPEGFVWTMKGGAGAMRISGSDSANWTRFWLAGVLPVARAGGQQDHRRSAFGRYISEAIFWTPAALLPGPGVAWEAVDENTARVTVEHNGNRQQVDLIVDAEGRLEWVVFERWSNANSEGTYRHQPFGGHLSDYREFEGFMLPTHVEAGNHYGTGEYFPFFIANVTAVRFSNQAR